MGDLTPPARPVLRDVPDVEILKVGTWPLSTGEFTFTPEHLAAAVAASQSTAVSRPVIKLGHTDPRFDGEPAVGFVDDLRLSQDGSTLVGDLRGLPGWLADIMPSAYPNRSIEGQLGYQDQTGKTWDFALTGLALLGVSPPAVGTLSSLRDVASLYEINAGRDSPAEGIRIMPGAIHATASVEDVRRSFYEAGPGTDLAFWIEEMYLDPAEIIAMNDENGELSKISFSISDDGAVTWGEPVTVKREYVAASAASHAPDAVYASAEESRPDTTKTTDPAEEPAEEDPMIDFTEAQSTTLISKLSLPEDADADAVLAAIDELAKKAEETTNASAAGEDGQSLAASAQARGMKLVEASAWDQTQNRLSTLESREHERVVDDAVRAGKLLPVSRERALTQLQAGLLSTDDIEGLEPVVTMAGREVGHTYEAPGSESDDVRDSDLYKNWN